MARTRRVARSRRRPPRVPASGAAVRDAFARDWARRTKTFAKLAGGSGDLSADDVHDLRVTTRRLRSSLSVLRHCSDVGDDKARRELRALGRVLGERRTLDIALKDAKRYRVDTGAIEKSRERADEELRRALKPARVKSLLARLREAEEGMAHASFDRLAHWLESLEWEIAYRLMVAPRTPDERHELRIQLKKVRYVIESLGRRSPSLQKLQDQLGKEHDLAVLQSLAGRIPRAAQDERAARTRANRIRPAALRSAMLHLRTIRRALAR